MPDLLSKPLKAFDKLKELGYIYDGQEWVFEEEVTIGYEENPYTKVPFTGQDVGICHMYDKVWKIRKDLEEYNYYVLRKNELTLEQKEILDNSKEAHSNHYIKDNPREELVVIDTTSSPAIIITDAIEHYGRSDEDTIFCKFEEVMEEVHDLKKG